MQLAYFRLYGKIGACQFYMPIFNLFYGPCELTCWLYGKIVSQYEPVLTKAFYHGRTEAMRTATEKAAAFCKIFMDPSANTREKLAALRVATQYHSAGIKLAASGQGIESETDLFSMCCIIFCL